MENFGIWLKQNSNLPDIDVDNIASSQWQNETTAKMDMFEKGMHDSFTHFLSENIGRESKNEYIENPAYLVIDAWRFFWRYHSIPDSYHKSEGWDYVWSFLDFSKLQEETKFDTIRTKGVFNNFIDRNAVWTGVIKVQGPNRIFFQRNQEGKDSLDVAIECAKQAVTL